MLRPLPTLTLLAALALATPAVAGSGSVGSSLAGQMAAAPGRATAAELKAAQGQVDASLKVRKQRHDAWQKAAKARDAAAAEVARLKRKSSGGAALEAALKGALALDEDVARARSSLLAAEADVARGGAALLKLYDALLVERRRAVEALPAQSSARTAAVGAYRELTAQRDAVRQVLMPVLKDEASADLPKGVDLEARGDDDVETLLEKADLARDLEARFLRQAEAVRRRIAELEEEQAVARDVTSMVGRSQLFDEEDRRLLVVRTEVTPAQNGTNTSTADGNRGDGEFGASENLDDGVPQGVGPVPNGESDIGGAPPPSLVGGPISTAASTSIVRGEQALMLPQTDAALSGVLSTSSMSVQQLKALEAKLKAQAKNLRDKQQKLKTEATRIAQ